MSEEELQLTKHCSKCRRVLPATLEYFAKLHTMALGLASRCRECANAHQKAKRAALRGAPRPTSTERFWAKVKRSGPEHCWEWAGGRQNAGYGVFWLEGKSVSAHVMSWQLANGSPGELYVLHQCDNPPCVNPDHLFLGDARDNALDMVAKGRNPDFRKLSDADIAQIKDLRKTGLPYKQIALRFPVTWETIRSVVKGRSRFG